MKQIGKGSKFTNHICVNSHVCTLPQNIHVVSYLFVGTDRFYRAKENSMTNKSVLCLTLCHFVLVFFFQSF